ncbi:MAG: hypothetical protein WC847_01445 [Candidatus Paceibacterota bacterium]|jgi:hypothetical protein
MRKTTAKNKIIKIVSAFLIILIIMPAVLFSEPKKTEAWMGIGDLNATEPVRAPAAVTTSSAATATTGTTGAGAASGATSAGLQIKNFAKAIYEQTLMAIARRLIQEVTKSTINWINSGFHGSPLFLENPSSFFTDITKSQVKDMANIYGFDSLKYPFGRNFILNTIQSYKSTLANNATYSLNKVMNATQAANYRNNFNVGGWNGFLLNTQYPQNNYLGFQMMANQQLAINLEGVTQAPAQKIQGLLQQGQGFLSPQKCSTNPDYNNGLNEFQRPSFDVAAYEKKHPACPDTATVCTTEDGDKYKAGLEKAKAEWAKKNTCPPKANGSSGYENTTPGSVVADQIKINLGSGIHQKELAAAMGNGISAILDTLINKFIGDGLNSLASKVNPPPPADNWSYGGETLDSSGSGNSWDSGPDQPIILSTFKDQVNGKTVGTCTNIKDFNGVVLPDQDEVSKAQCDAQKIVAVDIGICTSITDSTGSASVDQVDITKSRCDNLRGTWKKTGTLTANTPIWTPLGTCSSLTSPSGSALPDKLNISQAGCDIAKGTWKKDKIPGDIDNTQEEINLMDYADENNPENVGIIQLLKIVPLKTEILDQCIPGPDIGWEDRLKGEKERVSSKLQSLIGPDDELATKAMNLIIKELNFAVDLFNDFVSTKMISSSMQGSILYIDAVKQISGVTQQSKEVADAKRAKSMTLARLKSISKSLDAFNTQPEPGSPEEKILIAIKKQYEAIKTSISSTLSIENTRDELNSLKDQLKKLTSTDPKNPGLIKLCTDERLKEGWADPDPTGNGNSKNSKENNASEADLFCNKPISSGFSHGEIIKGYDWRIGRAGTPAGTPDPSGYKFTFRNPRNDLGDPGYTDIPLVNAQWVYGGLSCTGVCSWPDIGKIDFGSIGKVELFPGINDVKNAPSDNRVSVNLDCQTIFKAFPTDYTQAGNLSP